MGALMGFFWGFFCGIATLAGLATYVFIAMNASPATDAKKASGSLEEDDKKVATTTTEILQSLGIKPEEIERLKAMAGVMAPGGSMTGHVVAGGKDAAAGKDGKHGGKQGGGDEEERDLEAEFLETGKGAKARMKELKALMQLMTALATQSSTHAKALEKASNTAEAQAHAGRKEGTGSRGASGLSSPSVSASSSLAPSTLSETWWASLASMLLQVSDEQKRFSDAITLVVVERLQQMQERHAARDKQLNAEGARLLKDLHESTAAFATEEKERDRIQGKYDAYVTKLTNAGKSMQEIKESAEWKKLSKKLQEAEVKMSEANDSMAVANTAFSDKMPRILSDFGHLDDASESHERQQVLSFGELIKEMEDNTGKVAAKFVFAMQHYGKADHEVIYEQAMKSGGGQVGDDESPFVIDMDTDAIVQLAATNPSKIPTLPPRLVAGIGRESCVWFNAFSGRMYRDASSSVLFHEWMGGILFRLMNKGARPGYIDEFQVRDLRFGRMPPMLKNARWVPTSALEGADLNYDIAMVADMVYPGGFGFKVSTKLWMNWPKPGTAHLPISVDIELEELSGPVRIGVRKHQAYCSFLTEPHTRFTVKSTLGETNQISNVPKLSSIIISKMKQAIKSKLVHPKAKTFKLLWPRNWWPETAEQEVLRRKAGKQGPPPYSMVPPDSPMDASTSHSPIPLIIPPPPSSSTTTTGGGEGSTPHGGGVVSPLSDSSLVIDDVVSVASDNGSEVWTPGPPTEGVTRRGVLSSGVAATTATSFSIMHGSSSVTSTTTTVNGATNKKASSSMSSVFSSFYHNVKTKMATTAGATTTTTTTTTGATTMVLGGAADKAPPPQQPTQAAVSSGGAATVRSPGGLVGSSAAALGASPSSPAIGGAVPQQQQQQPVLPEQVPLQGGKKVVVEEEDSNDDDEGVAQRDSRASREDEGDDDEHDSDDDDEAGGEDHYDDDFKDKLMAATMDHARREELQALSGGAEEDEGEEREKAQPLSVPPPQQQQQEKVVVAEKAEEVAVTASSAVANTSPPMVQAAVTGGGGGTYCPVKSPAIAAWEGAWDEEATGLDGQDSMASHYPVGRTSSSSTSEEKSVADQPTEAAVPPKEEGEEAQAGGGAGGEEAPSLLLPSRPHPHRRASSSTHHVIIETETRKIALQVRDDSFELSKGASSSSLASTAPERYKRSKSTLGGSDYSGRRGGRKVVKAFQELGYMGQLSRRHSFAGLTAHQSRYIEIYANPKDEEEDAQVNSEAGVGRLTRVKSKDDCHEYAEQKNHWWTRQLQGVMTKGQQRAAGILRRRRRAGSHHDSDGDDEDEEEDDEAGDGKEHTSALKETKAKMKSLASKLFKSVQPKGGPAMDFLHLSPTMASAGGASAPSEYDPMMFSPLPVASSAEGASSLQSADGAVTRHEFSAWVREEVLSGVGGMGARKRWAKIRNKHMLLFENETESAVKSSLLLRDATCRAVKDSKLHAFEVTASRLSNGTVLPPKRTVFHAASDDELMAWVFHIQTAASSLVEDLAPPVAVSTGSTTTTTAAEGGGSPSS